MWTDSSSTLHFQNWADIDLERKSQKQGGTALTKGESQAVPPGMNMLNLQCCLQSCLLWGNVSWLEQFCLIAQLDGGSLIMFRSLQGVRSVTSMLISHSPCQKPYLLWRLHCINAHTYFIWTSASKFRSGKVVCLPPPPPSLNSCMKGLLGKIWLGMLWSFLVPSRSVHVRSLDSCWMEIPPLSKAFSSVCSAIMRGL